PVARMERAALLVFCHSPKSRILPPLLPFHVEAECRALRAQTSLMFPSRAAGTCLQSVVGTQRQSGRCDACFIRWGIGFAYIKPSYPDGPTSSFQAGAR